MKIGDTIYAVVDQDSTVLGDGESLMLCEVEPDGPDMHCVRRMCPWAEPRVVRVKLVEVDPVHGLAGQGPAERMGT